MISMKFQQYTMVMRLVTVREVLDVNHRNVYVTLEAISAQVLVTVTLKVLALINDFFINALIAYSFSDHLEVPGRSCAFIRLVSIFTLLFIRKVSFD